MNPREEAREKVKNLTNLEIAAEVDRLMAMAKEMCVVAQQRLKQTAPVADCLRRRRHRPFDRN